MIRKKFQGIAVPMITPVTKEGRMDTASVTRIMRRFAKNRISPLVLGTTGESASVNEQDGYVLMESVITMRNMLNVMAEKEQKTFRQQVYAGLVGNNVSQLIRQGNMYASLGVDAVVATLPSYYILTEEQMKRFYLSLADSIQVPVFIYNIKSTTQMSIPVSLAEELSHHPNIAGLKDSERDEERLRQSISLFSSREDFSFFCGWGAQGANSLKLGADGIVPSTGNVVPELYRKLYDAILREDFAEADRLQTLTDRVAAVYQKGLTLGESLAALKLLMKQLSLCGTNMLAPLTELSRSEANRVLQEFKILHL